MYSFDSWMFVMAIDISRLDGETTYDFNVLVFCRVDAQRIFGCKGVCETKGKNCKVDSCEKGVIYKNATECGCCDVCIISLKEGEKCETEVLPSIPRQACGEGLMCDKQEKKCVPVKTQCMEDRAKHRDTLSLEDLPYRTSWPGCDDFGYYKSMVCLPDILCYCVDKNGKRIFGTEIDSKVNQTLLEKYCKCSREYNEFPKSVPNGDFLRCLPNGDYDRLQCTEEWCYCMESENPDIIEAAEFNTTLKDLSCYNEAIHKDFDVAFRSKCWNERNNLKQIIKKHKDQNIALIGIDVPECDLDGSYAPVQCKNEKCFCVDENGKRYGEYEVNRYSKEAEEINCRCVRDKFLIRNEQTKNENMTLFDVYKCEKNGNYRPKESI